MKPPSSRPAQACTECGINATDGDYDEGDECFYCELCWARFEYLAAVVQFVRKRGTRVPVDEIGRSVPRPQARNGRPILKLTEILATSSAQAHGIRLSPDKTSVSVFGGRRRLGEHPGSASVAKVVDAVGGPGAGPSEASAKSHGPERTAKEAAMLFWSWMTGDEARKARCARRRELEAEFFHFREREKEAGMPLPKSCRAPSGMMHQLSTVLRLIRLDNEEVRFEDSSKKRVTRAREAAAQLMATRLKTQNRHDTSIEPEDIRAFVAVGEECRQTLTLKVDGSRSGDVVLKSMRFMQRGKHHGEDAVSALRLEHPELPVLLSAGSELEIGVLARPEQPGILSDMAVFTFHTDIQREKSSDEVILVPFDFSICRLVSFRAGNPAIEDLLRPTAPFSRAAFRRRPRTKSKIVDGEAPALTDSMVPYKKKLEQDDVIPALFRAKLEVTGNADEQLLQMQDDLCAADRDPSPTAKCLAYSRLYKHLLWAEERAMELDIRSFDLDKALLRPQQRLVALRVPGLSENRPSVLRGDYVVAYPCWDEHRGYRGFAHRIEQDTVLLKFSADFHDRLVDGMTARVHFSFRRSTLRLWHQAVAERILSPLPGMDPGQGTKPPVSMLFPCASDVAVSTGDDEPLVFYDRQLNPEQQEAVVSILKASKAGQSVPYIVFGPPGTGKTKTVIEAALQLCRQRMWCGRVATVLLTAPSNMAADLLLERLSSHLPKSEMLRFMAWNRAPNQVSSVNKSYARYDEAVGFVQPRLEDLLKFKVVVASCSMAAKLYNLGVPRGHFDAVFIDEAGQALEPEAVAVFTALYHTGQLVVLAGDHKQLGPMVRSDIANRYGLGTSFLERLGARPLYLPNAAAGAAPSGAEMDDDFVVVSADTSGNEGAALQQARAPGETADGLGYDTRVITKLVRNYRSHADILKTSNDLFYDGHLRCSDKDSEAYMRSQSLADWEGLPVQGFPLIFHGIEGKNEQEANSPSWFNIAECTQVLSYVQSLVNAKGRFKVQPSDIGIVTPYAKQVEKLSLLLRKESVTVGENGVMVGSAEKFQGQERRVIIISTVRSSESFLAFDASHNLGFVSNPKRFNVAVTRAQALLIVVGNASILARDKQWGKLLWMCHDKGAYVGMELPARSEEEEERKAAVMLDTLQELRLDDDSESDDDEHGPGPAEQQEMPGWRDD